MQLAVLLLLVGTSSGLVLLVRGLAHPSPPTANRLAQGPNSAPDRTTNFAESTLAGSFAGTVRSSEGSPVQGARVCATDIGTDAVGAPRTTCAETGSQGSYVIDLHATGAYWITAEAEGFVPGFVQGTQPATIRWGEHKARVDIVLQHGGAKVAGLVLDATGGPIPGAVIRAIRFAPPRTTVAVQSNAEGRFVLWALPGQVTLTADAVGYAGLRMGRVAPTSDAVFVLTPASSVQGNVVSAEDGSPVPGIEVRAVPIRGVNLPLNQSGVSNSEGVFEIQALEPGTYNLAAEGVGWRGKSATPLDVGLAQPVGHVTVAVTRATTVDGHVVFRSDGKPCQAGTVALGPYGGFRTPSDPPSAADQPPIRGVPTVLAAIDAEGAVQFRGVVPGTYHVFVRCMEHVFSEGPTTLVVDKENMHDLLWKVDSGLGLIVHVTNERNVPLWGAEFGLAWPGGGSSRFPTPETYLTTDADGSYEYPGTLYPGIYTVKPISGYGGTPIDVPLREGMGKANVTLRLAGRSSVLVRVQTKNGDPIDDVQVIASAMEDLLPAPPAPSATVSRTMTGGTAPYSPEQLARQNIPGAPLGNGRFRIGPFAPGRYKVQAVDGVNPPFAPQGSEGVVEVRPDEALETTITLSRVANIRGVVVDGANQPIPDVWVTAGCQGIIASPRPDLPMPIPGFMFPGRRVLSDLGGRFMVTGLDPGARCTLRAERSRGAVGTKQGVAPGDEVVISLQESNLMVGTK
jgi:hypothetical protein